MRSEAGPLRLDEHQRLRVKEVTIARYQAAAKPFADWLVSEHLDPRFADEWDDLLVEYKYVRSLTSRPFSKSDFECVIASVEFFFPRFRGQLAWARVVRRGWDIAYVPKHTMPVGRAWLHCSLATLQSWGTHGQGQDCYFRGPVV